MSKIIKHRSLAWCTGALQAFIGLTAIAGGYSLMSHPKGTPQMPIEWLHTSPFATFFIPGIVLLVLIGGVNVLSLAVTIGGGRHSGNLAVAGGACLVGYMTAEVWWIGWQTALQPLYLVLAVVLLLCGLALRRTLLSATGSTDAGAYTGKLKR
jgi:hypothetical protein